jgi:AcrR family transcriptional regulator
VSVLAVGFSFGEIAADVGIKGSSVHYHFPTKDDLAAAVVRRWAEYTSKHVDGELEKVIGPRKSILPMSTPLWRRMALGHGDMEIDVRDHRLQ